MAFYLLDVPIGGSLRANHGSEGLKFVVSEGTIAIDGVFHAETAKIGGQQITVTREG